MWITSTIMAGLTLVDGERFLESASTLSGGSNPEFNVFGSRPCAVQNVSAFPAASERDALLHQRDSSVVFQLGGVFPGSVLTPLAPDTPGQILFIPAMDRSGARGGTMPQGHPWYLSGNLASVGVTAGGCKVRGDSADPWRTAPDSAVVAIWGPYSYGVEVDTTGVTSGVCTLHVVPYLPNDLTGALSPGTAVDLTVIIGSPQ